MGMQERETRFAIFVLNGADRWERKSALQLKPTLLLRLLEEDESLRGIPSEERDVLKGPESILSEKSIPSDLLAELLRKKMLEVV